MGVLHVTSRVRLAARQTVLSAYHAPQDITGMMVGVQEIVPLITMPIPDKGNVLNAHLAARSAIKLRAFLVWMIGK